MNYYDFPAISNSMLSEYEKTLFPSPTFGDKDKANQFGQLVHCLILEKDCDCIDVSLLSEDEINTVHLIAQNALKQPFVKWLRRWTAKEKEVYWTEQSTGLPCKSKIDSLFKKTVIDLKTTSAKTENEFKRNILAFKYNRQGAFYMDSVGAKRFIIVGLQKKAPFNIWKIEISKTDLDIGRKQYLQLLKHGHRHGYFKTLLTQNENIKNTRTPAPFGHRSTLSGLSSHVGR